MEKDYGGLFIFTRGERKDFGGELGVLDSIGQSEFTVEFTVHRGAEEVLGSEG